MPAESGIEWHNVQLLRVYLGFPPGHCSVEMRSSMRTRNNSVDYIDPRDDPDVAFQKNAFLRRQAEPRAFRFYRSVRNDLQHHAIVLEFVAQPATLWKTLPHDDATRANELSVELLGLTIKSYIVTLGASRSSFSSA